MKRSFEKYLVNEGGSKDAIGDYSSVKSNFSYTLPDDAKYAYIKRMIVYLKDNGQLSQDGYGAGSALSNGIELRIIRADGSIEDLLDGIPVTTNGNWARTNYDVNPLTFGGGDNAVVVRWSFDKYSKNGKKINQGDIFGALMQDNLSVLNEHRIMIEGEEFTTWE